MPTNEWAYRERSPDFKKAGTFTAWIGGSGGRFGSAAASRVEVNDGSESPIERVDPSRGKSTDQRANLAAAVACLEALQAGSEVTILTRVMYVVDAIASRELWRAEGWRTSSGLRKNAEILQRLDHLIRTRKLKVSVRYVPKGSGLRGDEIIERLTQRAHEARPEK